MASQIRRLDRADIDDAAWDAAVSNDPAPLPYALSWWLDAVTERKWEGLVLDDYRAVLPLPRSRRFGIVPAISRPPFSQQMGPFGNMEPGDLRALLSELPRFTNTTLTLRHGINTSEIPASFRLHRRTNLVLDLSPPFEDTLAAFPRKLRALIRRSSADRLEDAMPEEVVELYASQLRGRGGLKQYHFDRLLELIESALDHNIGNCYRLFDEGELLCAGFFPTYGRRTINLAGASTSEGMHLRGMSRMLCLVMKRQSGTPGHLFDFEGSDIPGVKEYFMKFGPRVENYWQI